MSEYNKRKAEKMTGELCKVCDTPLYSDPGAHELGIYLHAVRYADREGRWSYETGLPAWALPPVGAVGPVEVTRETDPLVVAEKVEAGAEEGLGALDDGRRDGGGENKSVGKVDEVKPYIEPSKSLWVMPG